VAWERFLDREEAEPENIKYKFRLAPKLPRICINQKYSMGVGSLHILLSLNLNGGLGVDPQRLAIWGIY